MQDIFILKGCSCCGAEKSIEFFPKTGDQCKECKLEKRQKVKEDKRKYDQEYRIRNREKLSQQHKNYDQENRIERQVRKKEYVKRRRLEDPSFRLRHYVSKYIRTALGANKGDSSCLQHLSFSMNELRAHLEKQFEPWMNWNNQGKYRSTWNDSDISTWTWQIDHIIPQSDLPYVSMKEDNFKKCWALNNLRPLSAKQNLLDGVKKVRHKRSENV